MNYNIYSASRISFSWFLGRSSILVELDFGSIGYFELRKDKS